MIEIEYSQNLQFNLVKQTHGASLDAAEAFARAIKPYTYATIDRVAYAEDRMINLKDTRAPVIPSNIHNYAQIFVRDVATNDLFCVLLPAPIVSMFEIKAINEEKMAYVVKLSPGKAIAEIYSELAGKEFVFAHGALQGRRTEE